MRSIRQPGDELQMTVIRPVSLPQSQTTNLSVTISLQLVQSPSMFPAFPSHGFMILLSEILPQGSIWVLRLRLHYLM